MPLTPAQQVTLEYKRLRNLKAVIRDFVELTGSDMLPLYLKDRGVLTGAEYQEWARLAKGIQERTTR